MNIMLAMLTTALWGTTYAVTQYTVPDWPPLLLGAVRALPAGLILWCVRPRLPAAGHWPALIKLGAVNITLFFSLIFVMAHTLPSAVSGVGMVSVPLFAMLFQLLVLNIKPKATQVMAGALLLVLGALLFNPASLTLSPVGLVAMLAAIGCIVVGSRMTQTLSGKLHWWDVLVWQLIVGGSLLALLAAAHWLAQPAAFSALADGVTAREAAGMVWMVLLNTVLAYGIYVFLMQRMTVVEFTFGNIANPITGIALGVWLLGEQYSSQQYGLMAGMIFASLLPSLLPLWSRKRP